MINQSYSRQFSFESVFNFRDLGGYMTHQGGTVAWRRVFRSGYLNHMTDNDLILIKNEIRLNTVIDLRNSRELEQMQEFNLFNNAGIKYFNIPIINFMIEDMQKDFSDMSEVYLFLVRHNEVIKRIIEAMEIIAEPENHPLAFHCMAGKDRTGLLAAFILSVLGVADEDIIEDYSQSAHHMNDLIKRLMMEPGTREDIESMPAYIWGAEPTSMTLFLEAFKREHGSVRNYLEMKGAGVSLFQRLEKALVE